MSDEFEVNSEMFSEEDHAVIKVTSPNVEVVLRIQKNKDAGGEAAAIMENLPQITGKLFREAVAESMAVMTPEHLQMLEVARISGNEAAQRLLDRHKKGEFSAQDHHRDQDGEASGTGH